VIALDGDALGTEKDARFSMLETLADHDDELMEQLLADIPPPRDRVFDDLAKELRDGLVCPVLIGVATRTNGVLRLLKALRHEAPGVAATAKRLGVKAGGDAVATVLKTFHTTHGGKLSVARVLNGQIGDGVTLHSPTDEAGRVSGVAKMLGQSTEKRGPAAAGETVAFGKLDHAKTGDTLSSGAVVGQAAAPRGRGGEALSGRARHRDLGEGAQGRRQARPRAQQAARGGSLAHHVPQSRDP
jgi:elongation factor G